MNIQALSPYQSSARPPAQVSGRAQAAQQQPAQVAEFVQPSAVTTKKIPREYFHQTERVVMANKQVDIYQELEHLSQQQGGQQLFGLDCYA